MEFHEQINFDNLDVCVVDKTNVILSVSSDISVLEKVSANNEKKKYEKFIAKDSNYAKLFLDSANDGEYLTAFSYTEAPLKLVCDHFERIEKDEYNFSLFDINASALSNTSSGNSKYHFTLTTKITRTGTSIPYTYKATTNGMWNDNSILGGAQYPASGDDFVLQACPYDTYGATFFCRYNHNVAGTGSVYGRSGYEYSAESGGNCYIRYGVKDDPVGNEQLVDFSMSQKFQTNQTSKMKKINSYYVHTWKQMTISVGVQGTVGTSNSISLTITPSIVEKQWQLYDYVVCNW